MAITRREFVGGLLVSFAAGRVFAGQPSGASLRKPQTSDPVPTAGLQPNVFVHVASDGHTAIRTPTARAASATRTTACAAPPPPPA